MRGQTKHDAGESSSLDVFTQDAKRFVLSNDSMLKE
jgi:hypothetical protein